MDQRKCEFCGSKIQEYESLFAEHYRCSNCNRAWFKPKGKEENRHTKGHSRYSYPGPFCKRAAGD